jgi:pimeloyl-ACP methyl ester carboxylesterase
MSTPANFTALTLDASAPASAQAEVAHTTKNIVLVHGGFVDGSGWQGVYDALTKMGYAVTIVQNPTASLADDVAVTKRAISTQDGSVILVGHSYGGVVITEAGNGPKVAGLVYVAAFAPDAGESVETLIASPAPGAPVPPILPPQDGYLFLDKSKFCRLLRSRREAAGGGLHGSLSGSVGRSGAERKGNSACLAV